MNLLFLHTSLFMHPAVTTPLLSHLPLPFPLPFRKISYVMFVMLLHYRLRTQSFLTFHVFLTPIDPLPSLPVTPIHQHPPLPTIHHVHHPNHHLHLPSDIHLPVKPNYGHFPYLLQLLKFLNWRELRSLRTLLCPIMRKQALHFRQSGTILSVLKSHGLLPPQYASHLLSGILKKNYHLSICFLLQK
jgi:hypothetical protein